MPLFVDRAHYLRASNAQEKHSERINHLRLAVESNPEFVDAWLDLALSCLLTDKLDLAKQSIEALDNLDPQHPGLRLLKAKYSFTQGDDEDARQYLDSHLSRFPKDAEAHFEMGNVEYVEGNQDKAIADYRMCLSLEPNHVFAKSMLSKIGAAPAEAAIERQQDTAESELLNSHHSPQSAIDEMNNALKLGEFGMASAIGDALLESQYKELADVQAAVANVQGQVSIMGNNIQAAIILFEKSLHYQPENFDVRWSLISTASSVSRHDLVSEHSEYIRSHGEPDYPGQCAAIMWMLYPDDISDDQINAAHRHWGKQISKKITPVTFKKNPPDSNTEKLKIGFISQDFHQHPVAKLLEPLLQSLDKTRVKVYCYSLGNTEDITSKLLRRFGHQWRWCHDQSITQTVDTILADELDVLIDLAGHTSMKIMSIMAYKPSLKQGSHLGYPFNTGLPTIDFRITDQYCDPPHSRNTEDSCKLLDIADCFLCFQPDCYMEFAKIDPQLSDQHIWFCFFNAPTKINDNVLETWARILHSVSNGYILIRNSYPVSPQIKSIHQQQFKAHGIDPVRIEMQQGPTGGHLNAYNGMNLNLDPFPYGGAMTTLDSLWMGVPSVTLKGCSHRSRVTAMLLETLGYPQLVANNVDEYVQKRIEFSTDSAFRLRFATDIRSKMSSSVLMDSKHYAEKFTNALFSLF